ncbi:MAG: FAD/NAD(P)-binding protein [Planctomycetota bacterium]|nr:FAD/NAD(P)-binding protein [Planctomycetota bacterium]
MENIYKPYLMTVESTRDEAPGVTTLKLKFQNDEERKTFFSKYKVGQFGEYSLFGAGECTFCVASPPTRQDYIECTFRKAGRVTGALQEVNVGDTIGFRGPYGNWFPLEQWKGKNLLFIAGGIALPPMRAVIWNCLDLRDWFKDITILYGARTVPDLVYKQELAEWTARPDVKVVQTVDPGCDVTDWKCQIGFVPTVLDQITPNPDSTIALICGPPIMIKFTFPVLKKYKFEDKDIYTTLENRMKCGLGKCGRCNVANVYVCKEGPVFTFTQLAKLPPEY